MPVAASTTAVALIIALVTVEVVLMAWCIVDLVRRPAQAVAFGTKLPWYFIILLLSFAGPIVYLAAARRDVPLQDDALARPEEAAVQDRTERAVELLYGTDTTHGDEQDG